MAYANSEGDSSDSLLGYVSNKEPEYERVRRRPRYWLILSTIATLFNLVFFGVNVYLRLERNCAADSYERGFATDLVPDGLKFNLVQRQYGGGVEIGSNGHFVTDLSGQEYVGKPSPAVDGAWSSLLTGLNIDLDPSDVDMSGRSIRWPDNGNYFTGFEVFHSLHCLNRLRQALYPEYYAGIFTQAGDPDREQHIGHCINHLRQSLECHADLSPMEWRFEGNRVLLDTTTPHTCRDFKSIHEWARERRTQWDALQSVANGTLVVVD